MPVPNAARHPLRFRPSPADRRVLEAVNAFDVLTTQQVCQLLYAPASITSVRARLKRLCQAGYLLREPFTYRRPFSAYARGGSSPALYTIGRAGWAYLQSLGVPVPRRYHSTERARRSPFTLEHWMLCNQALIAAKLLCDRHPTLRIRQWVPERRLVRPPSTVTLGSGRQRAVLVDGWLSLAKWSAQPFACFAMEVDMGTETNKRRVQEMLEARLLWSQGTYQRDFGTDILQILYYAVPGPYRRDQLLRWCEELLTRLGQEAEADLLLFTHLSPGTASPDDLYYKPVWYAPFADQPRSLLTSEEGRP